MGGLQPLAASAQAEALERELAAEARHHDRSGPGLAGTIHHQQITVLDAGALHRIAGHTQQHGVSRIANQ